MNSPRDIHVAIVDDDESTRRSFSRLLRASGFVPVAYQSAEAFLGDSQQSRFECLVLDIQLEGMSGIELQKQLSAQGNSIPVIFITAQDQEPDIREEALAAGCAAYFRKTDSGSKVLEAIHRAVDRQPKG